ncbi:unnamed protein product [Calypogeia fissa]
MARRTGQSGKLVRQKHRAKQKTERRRAEKRAAERHEEQASTLAGGMDARDCRWSGGCQGGEWPGLKGRRIRDVGVPIVHESIYLPSRAPIVISLKKVTNVHAPGYTGFPNDGESIGGTHSKPQQVQSATLAAV